MPHRPVAVVRPRINKPLHVKCSHIRLMNVNELYDLRKIIVRALDAQRFHGESIVSDQYMSWVRGLYHVDTTLIRHRLRLGLSWC
jgi:hypothetical protein